MKQFNIGLFGFGSVGHGLYDVLQRVGMNQINIKRVCVRNVDKYKDIPLDITNNADDIFNDKDINLIVELIDDADASLIIVRRALQAHIPVVSGNKKMLAYNLPELIKLQKSTGTQLLYDASACGSIPVIRNLEEYYDNDLLVSVKGILNGSSNFILSKIFNEKMNYADALKLAQDLGFAESNPALDIDGWDSLFKLIIITVHAFGVYVDPSRIFRYGISSMNNTDIRFANEKDRRIKLVGHVEKTPEGNVYMCVIPQLISRSKYIYGVEDEFNGVVIKGEFYYKQFMFGRGAGGHPTGSAVLSDITACLYDYGYEYKRMHKTIAQYSDNVMLRIYFRYKHPEDLALISFNEIREEYRSQDYNYIVGDVCLHDLIAINAQLSGRDLFIAAYPWD